MYRDSEMVIWFSSGPRPGVAFVRPLFRFAWPVLLVIALLAVVVWPWANQQTQDMRDRYEQRGDLERVAPGQFQESAERQAACSSSTRTRPTTRPAATSSSPPPKTDKQTVTSARSGRIDTVGDDQLPDADNGQRLESALGQAGHCKISEFEEYGSRSRRQRRWRCSEAAPRQDRCPPATLMREPDAAPTWANWPGASGMALAAINFVLHGAGRVQRQPARRAAAATWSSRCSPLSSTTTC